MCVFLCFYVLFAVCVNGPLWTDFQINGNANGKWKIILLSTSPYVASAGVRELETPKYKCEAPIIGGLGAEPRAGSSGRALGVGTKPLWS